MSALDRVERNNKGDIMVPVNVEGLADNDGLSPKQAIVLFGLLGILVIDILWFKGTKAGRSFLMWVANIGLFLSVAQYLIRKLVFNENYKMAQIEALEKFKKCKPALMWDIMAVNDDTSVMQFGDGRVAVLLGIEQATIIGREPDFNHIHYNAISDFLKELNKSNVKWIHLNLMMNARNDTRLSVLGDTVTNCEIPSIQNNTRMHLGYLRGMEARTLYEMEYYMIIASPLMGADKLLNVVDEAVSLLSNAAYNKITILDGEKIEQVMAEVSLVDFFDAEETMRQMAKTKTVLKEVFKIETIELVNCLKEEDLHPGVMKSAFVHRDADKTVINVVPEVKTKLLQYTNLMKKEGAEVEKGTLEKYLLGSKNKNKKIVDSVVDSAENGNSLLEENSNAVFGNSDIVDVVAFARSEEAEAKEAAIKLGMEEEWKKQQIKEANARTAAELKAKAEEEERLRKEEEERKEAELAAIEEARKIKEAKKVDVNDFM